MQSAVGERIISILACHCTLHAARLTCWQVVASGVTEGWQLWGKPTTFWVNVRTAAHEGSDACYCNPSERMGDHSLHWHGVLTSEWAICITCSTVSWNSMKGGWDEQSNADFLVVGANQFTVVVLFVVVVFICFVDIQYSEAESSRSMWFWHYSDVHGKFRYAKGYLVRHVSKTPK